MWNRNFNSFLKKAVIAIVAAVVMVPVGTLARTNSSTIPVNPNRGAEQTETKNIQFCAHAAGLVEKMQNRLSARGDTVQTLKQNLTNKFMQGAERRDDKLDSVRERWNERRSEFYEKLDARAATDVQKQALADFHEAVEAAVAVHRAAIDAAIKASRQAIQDAATAREQAVAEAMNRYRNAVRVAKEKALSDCESGVDPQTVRLNLQAQLKAAQQEFQSDRQAIEKRRDLLEPVLKARRDAVKKANDEFRAALEKARADLKAALANKTDEGT